MSRQARHLPFDQWPAADRQAWTAALRAPSLFDDDGGMAAGWARQTREEVQRQYGYWLNYLNQQQLLTGDEPAARVTPARLNAYAVHLCETISINSVVIYLQKVHQALRALAPRTDWHWVNELVKRWERMRTGPVRDKRPRLRNADQLVDLGLTLMDEAIAAIEAEPGSARKEQLRCAVQYRDGLMIALLAMRPLRRRTFSLIRIGKELARIGEHWHLQFSPEQTKTHTEAAFTFPTVLVGRLETYLHRIRPIFPGAEAHDALWASSTPGPLKGDAIYHRIRHWTEARLGVPINMHLFRDCAATTLANADHRGVNNAAALLGHKQLTTTERHYIQADRRQATVDYQAILAGRREKGAR